MPAAADFPAGVGNLENSWLLKFFGLLKLSLARHYTFYSAGSSGVCVFALRLPLLFAILRRHLWDKALTDVQEIRPGWKKHIISPADEFYTFIYRGNPRKEQLAEEQKSSHNICVHSGRKRRALLFPVTRCLGCRYLPLGLLCISVGERSTIAIVWATEQGLPAVEPATGDLAGQSCC